jgi:hypothetical protein
MTNARGRAVCGLLLSALLSACVPATTVRTEVGNQYLIPREELAARPAASVFDIVSATRPAWLQVPVGTTAAGGTGMVTAEVYIDGRSVGPLEVLRTISSGEAEKVCYFRPTHAQNRFGLRAKGAVIEVFTRGTEYATRAC